MGGKVKNQMSGLLGETMNEKLPSSDLVQKVKTAKLEPFQRKGEGAFGIHKRNNDRSLEKKNKKTHPEK